mmetsp:Transcript_11569/g.36619  ORF Transcript_11569/g.36619 Transcript_11569/m.36619 type:complete len:103 (-) Transcript_11569:42-350(-)
MSSATSSKAPPALSASPLACNVWRPPVPPQSAELEWGGRKPPRDWGGGEALARRLAVRVLAGEPRGRVGGAVRHADGAAASMLPPLERLSYYGPPLAGGSPE